MKIAYTTILTCSLSALVACEKEVEFNAPDTESFSAVTINAIAAEGEPLTVFLNKTYSMGKAPLLNVGYLFPFSKSEALSDYHSDDYFKKTAIFDADVRAVVNAQQNYILTLAADSMGYVCDYRPHAGDHIEVLAEGLRP